jgi:hypothetical protein
VAILKNLYFNFPATVELELNRLRFFGKFVVLEGNRNDFFATRGADIAILTGFGMDLLVMNY